MTTTVDPNLTEQQRFVSITEFARQTGMSASQASRGVADGSIQSIKITQKGRPWILKCEVEKYKGMRKAAPRGLTVHKTTSQIDVKSINEVLGHLNNLGKVTEAIQRLCDALKEKLLILGTSC